VARQKVLNILKRKDMKKDESKLIKEVLQIILIRAETIKDEPLIKLAKIGLITLKDIGVENDA